jgi:hypothetical protein
LTCTCSDLSHCLRQSYIIHVQLIAPNEGQSLSNFVDVKKLPKDLLIIDSGGFVYINPDMFPQAFAQDINSTEADVMAIV